MPVNEITTIPKQSWTPIASGSSLIRVKVPADAEKVLLLATDTNVAPVAGDIAKSVIDVLPDGLVIDALSPELWRHLTSGLPYLWVWSDLGSRLSVSAA